MSKLNRKVLILGLDCAPPELLFDRFLNDLPNIRSLVGSGVYGSLESTVPPITVPAWMSMVTGKDPGALGVYGLRNRTDHSYRRMAVANARFIREDTLWDILSRAGKHVILVGVPQTYPPKPVNGCLIASFLTPDNRSRYTYPEALQAEVERIADGYVLDVRNFRTDDKAALLKQIYDMTEKRFRVTKRLMQTRPWDLVMHVEMGTDRIHHGFWRFLDETHRKHDPASEFKNAIRDYYRYLDREIGELIALAGADTAVLLVSDHGAKRIDGGICVNEWLLREGYLKLKAMPAVPTDLDDLEVDWEKTDAWGAGGYYARIFLNVAGREPQGIIPAGDYDSVRDDLARKLAAIPSPDGAPLPTKVFKPEETYRVCNGVPPDLIVYFGDLFWRSVGIVGGGNLYATENDTGPDDANHAQQGVFVLRDGISSNRRLENLDIRDVAPTVLALMGLPVPQDMQGRSVIADLQTERPTSDQQIAETPPEEVYTEEEKKIMEDRLRALGYL